MELAWLYWNPPRDAFTLPFIDRPVTWYGICFVIGFMLGYWVMVPVVRRFLSQKLVSKDTSTLDQLSHAFVDKLCLFVVIGTIVGARLGTVLFYDWDYYSQHPIEILKTWKGGLASHGGALGVLIALYFFWRSAKKKLHMLSFINVLDMISVPIPLAAVFIRIGNFINQEILGTPSDAPWAVIFGQPSDGSFPEPRHPVQLYEGLAYLTTFVFLYSLWRWKGDQLKTGTLFGWMLTLIFSSRFFLEFWKSSQESSLGDFGLQMGQILSIPFIVAGVAILVYSSISTKKI